MLKILNRTNGQYPDSQVYWSYNGQTHSIAEQPYFDMPANTAGRMYFYVGSPTSQYNDFIEFTVGPNVFNGNTTRVDAFALKLAMRLHADDGYDVAVGEDYATFAEVAGRPPSSGSSTRCRPSSTTWPRSRRRSGSRRRAARPSSSRVGSTQNYLSSYAASVGSRRDQSADLRLLRPAGRRTRTCAPR